MVINNMNKLTMGKYKVGDLVTFSKDYGFGRNGVILVVEKIEQDEWGDNYFCRIKGYPTGTWLRENNMEYLIDSSFTTDEIHYSLKEKLTN